MNPKDLAKLAKSMFCGLAAAVDMIQFVSCDEDARERWLCWVDDIADAKPPSANAAEMEEFCEKLVAWNYGLDTRTRHAVFTRAIVAVTHMAMSGARIKNAAGEIVFWSDDLIDRAFTVIRRAVRMLRCDVSFAERALAYTNTTDAEYQWRGILQDTLMRLSDLVDSEDSEVFESIIENVEQSDGLSRRERAARINQQN